MPAGLALPVPQSPSATEPALIVWETKIMSLAKAPNATRDTGTNTELVNDAITALIIARNATAQDQAAPNATTDIHWQITNALLPTLAVPFPTTTAIQ